MLSDLILEVDDGRQLHENNFRDFVGGSRSTWFDNTDGRIEDKASKTRHYTGVALHDFRALIRLKKTGSRDVAEQMSEILLLEAMEGEAKGMADSVRRMLDSAKRSLGCKRVWKGQDFDTDESVTLSGNQIIKIRPQAKKYFLNPSSFYE